jgi:hypothetical protein
LENWVDVKWWDNNMPGNCYQGCFEPAPFFKKTSPYTTLNYGFSFLAENPDPDQLDCTGQHGGAKDPGCPVWDGNAIYLSKSSRPFAVAVDSSTTAEKPTPSIIAISEAVRMGRMHPDGPKRVKIVLGGWSDFARLETPELAVKAGELGAKLVKYTFADGIDLDFEHLTPFNNMTSDHEFAAFASLITTLRSEFTKVEADWKATAKARHDALLAEYNAMQPWQRNNAKQYYSTNLQYLKELQANDVPKLEISWCTRFNAFVPKDDPFNYHMPGTPVPNTTYPTDNEGLQFWPQIADAVDTINIMAYDAGGLVFNFTQILENFVNIGNVSKSKINMGFEPGAQYAGGVWEGATVDKAAAKWIKENEFGGVMIWAVNPSSKQNPSGAVDCPELASTMKEIVQPVYAFGNVPNYSKCSASTGYLPDAPIPTPTPPSPPSPPGPPGPPGKCAAAWQQCSGAGHPTCCEGTCQCSGSGTYKQCTPAKGKWQC